MLIYSESRVCISCDFKCKSSKLHVEGWIRLKEKGVHSRGWSPPPPPPKGHHLCIHADGFRISLLTDKFAKRNVFVNLQVLRSFQWLSGQCNLLALTLVSNKCKKVTIYEKYWGDSGRLSPHLDHPMHVCINKDLLLATSLVLQFIKLKFLSIADFQINEVGQLFQVSQEQTLSGLCLIWDGEPSHASHWDPVHHGVRDRQWTSGKPVGFR